MSAAAGWREFLRNLEGFSIERAIHYSCVDAIYGQPHTHDDRFHIAFLFVGETPIRIGSRSHLIGPSDAVFIPPGVVHFSVGGHRTYLELVEIHFLAGSSREAATVPRLQSVTHIHNLASFVPALERLIVSHSTNPGASNWLSRVHLAELLMLLEREGARSGSAPLRAGHVRMKIHEVMEHLASDYREGHSVKELAALAGMSPSHFAARFREVAATSPIEYLIRVRLLHAKELLRESDYSIKQIAAITGFSSSQYFARIFARRERMSPTGYRKAAVRSSDSAQVS